MKGLKLEGNKGLELERNKGLKLEGNKGIVAVNPHTSWKLKFWRMHRIPPCIAPSVSS